jgi:hypothetical protein
MIHAMIWDKFPEEALDGFSNGVRLSQCRLLRGSDPPLHAVGTAPSTSRVQCHGPERLRLRSSRYV